MANADSGGRASRSYDGAFLLDLIDAWRVSAEHDGHDGDLVIDVEDEKTGEKFSVRVRRESPPRGN